MPVCCYVAFKFFNYFHFHTSKETCWVNKISFLSEKYEKGNKQNQNFIFNLFHQKNKKQFIFLWLPVSLIFFFFFFFHFLTLSWSAKKWCTVQKKSSWKNRFERKEKFLEIDSITGKQKMSKKPREFYKKSFCKNSWVVETRNRHWT